jgi:hypothetical protein
MKMTEKDKITQEKDIWNWLETHPEGLTVLEACIHLGCTKLSTRAGEMIRKGYPISKTPEKRVNERGMTKRYMRYRKAAAV